MLAVGCTSCAGNAARSCQVLAGPGWDRTAAPADATALMALDGLQEDGKLIWLQKGEDQLMACRYGGPLVSPGCQTSHAYAFKRSNGAWHANGELLDTCGD
ncbi:MAG: hypothetical protein KGJ55_04830 [Gammaproteobacteria bacterium]|nr:hypothetical protein [Gammaproteobacteria bacterium]